MAVIAALAVTAVAEDWYCWQARFHGHCLSRPSCCLANRSREPHHHYQQSQAAGPPVLTTTTTMVVVVVIVVVVGRLQTVASPQTASDCSREHLQHCRHLPQQQHVQLGEFSQRQQWLGLALGLCLELEPHQQPHHQPHPSLGNESRAPRVPSATAGGWGNCAHCQWQKSH